jgi:hypothetical protein
MKLQPVNIIALIIMLGLEFLILGVEEQKIGLKILGGGIAAAGWILNTIAICQGGLT